MSSQFSYSDTPQVYNKFVVFFSLLVADTRTQRNNPAMYIYTNMHPNTAINMYDKLFPKA